MKRFAIAALLLMLTPLTAFAACQGAGGVPFNCTVGTTPAAGDLVMGGNTSGAQAGQTVQFNFQQLAAAAFSFAPAANPNTIFGGPASGGAGAPSFRSLVAADLPLATNSAPGAVQADGLTILANNGVLSAATATNSSQGIVQPDGITTVVLNGVISATGGGGGGGCAGVNCTFAGTTSLLGAVNITSLLTANGSLTVNGTTPITINTIPASGGLVGGIINNSPPIRPFPSGNARDRYFYDVLDATGSPTGLEEASYHGVEVTTLGTTSAPLVTATISGGAIVSPLTISATGGGLLTGTYTAIVTGGGGSGAVVSVSISGGIVQSATCSPCGSGYTTVPTVNIPIGNVAKETNVVHPFFRLDETVSYTGLVDPAESSGVVNGDMSQGTFSPYNALLTVGPNGTLGTFGGMQCQLVNQNPRPGSVFSTVCLFVQAPTGQAPTGTGGSVTATESGGTVTLSSVPGSGYQNSPTGTTYTLVFTGGSCALEPTGTFTVVGGAISSPTLTFAGSNCLSNPTVTLLFGSIPKFDLVARISDQFSTFATQGNVLITDSTGNFTPPAQNVMLSIKASSMGVNQFLLNLTSAVGNVLLVNAAGNATLYGTISSGTSGHANGALLLTNATASSAFITVLPPTGTVLSAVNVVIPDVAGTLAEAITATSSSIGGSALLAGACASTTVTATNATTGMTVAASPVTYPGDGAYWYGYVSSSNTVTVKVCAAVALTPTASTYNIRVIQ